MTNSQSIGELGTLTVTSNQRILPQSVTTLKMVFSIATAVEISNLTGLLPFSRLTAVSEWINMLE
jgi:hypothetical protein